MVRMGLGMEQSHLVVSDSINYYKRVFAIILLQSILLTVTVTNPANGRVSIEGVTATYTCDTGYSLVGSRTRTCGPSGNWSTAAPTCQCIAEYSVCVYIVILNSFSC